jgi:quinol monooxygenase YgiN
MIVRVFRARIHEGKEDDFRRFLVEKGLPITSAAEGCSHVTAGKSHSGGAEFIVISHWESVESLQAFAGPNWQQAVVLPEEEYMLAEVSCEHYGSIQGTRS